MNGFILQYARRPSLCLRRRDRMRVVDGNLRWKHSCMLAVDEDPPSGRAGILGRVEHIQAQRDGILRNARPERSV